MVPSLFDRVPIIKYDTGKQPAVGAVGHPSLVSVRVGIPKIEITAVRDDSASESASAFFPAVDRPPFCAGSRAYVALYGRDVGVGLVGAVGRDGVHDNRGDDSGTNDKDGERRDGHRRRFLLNSKDTKMSLFI